MSPIDLKKVTESTRRALYDAIVATYFTPTPEERQHFAEDPHDHWIPTYGPDEAGLVVFYLRGRWIAIWRETSTRPRSSPRIGSGRWCGWEQSGWTGAEASLAAARGREGRGGVL